MKNIKLEIDMLKGSDQKLVAAMTATPFIMFALAAVVATILNPSIFIAIVSLLFFSMAVAVYAGLNSNVDSVNDNLVKSLNQFPIQGFNTPDLLHIELVGVPSMKSDCNAF